MSRNSFSVSSEPNTNTYADSYADKTQNPLATYGAENIAFMKDVAAKYDPSGIFQTRQPGGFKLAKLAGGSASNTSTS